MRKVTQTGPGGLKVLIFGPWGSGKTYSIKGLLELGYTVYVLCTDLGGSGLATVQNALRGRSELDNLYYIELRGFREVLDFIENPVRFDPEFFTRADDVVLFWDGFSHFQSADVMEYVGENAPGRDPGELRSEGFQLELLDWNAVRNATLRALGDFLRIEGPRPDHPWHKIVTCQEATRAKRKASGSPTEPSIVVDERRPLLSGQGGILAGAAFDLIVETRAKRTGDEDGQRASYVYVTEGDDIVYVKRRGFNLPAVMPADMAVLWRTICEQAGIRLPESKTENEK
jgi:hypothetical protein